MPSKDRNKRAATSPFASPSQVATIRKKSLHFHNDRGEMEEDDDDDDEDGEISDSLADLPISDNAVSGHTLKQMHMTLQKDIQKDLSRSISHIQLQVDNLGAHTDKVERQLTDFTDAYNELVDAHRE